MSLGHRSAIFWLGKDGLIRKCFNEKCTSSGLGVFVVELRHVSEMGLVGRDIQAFGTNGVCIDMAAFGTLGVGKETKHSNVNERFGLNVSNVGDKRAVV